MIGSRISHFEILQKLGEGGMGVVYKARDLRLDRLVALKVLSEKSAGSAERHLRLVQEAKAASALNHPNIITVHEIDTVDGVTFIAMEYVEGRTLEQVIPQKGLRYTEALKYAVQITDALAAAHAIGIVHRDLKPSNLMLTEKGTVKVLDFGLAKVTHQSTPAPTQEMATIGADAKVTQDGAIAGTVAYMSPEQAEGKKIDARSDIFSFGIVLYEMLTGRRPFAGDTQLSTLAAVVNQEPKPVRQIVEGLPAELDRVVTRCLRKEVSRRFQAMPDLTVALQELREESDSGVLAPVPARRKVRPAWIVAGIVAVAAAGIWLLVKPRTTPPQTVTTVTNYANTEQQPSVSPDGRQVAFSWDGEKGDNFDIYVKLIGETGALRLTTDAAEDSFPSWSPDGKRIAFLRRGDRPGIYTISASGGAEQKLTTLPMYGQPSWSPDGKWLAFSNWPGTLILFPMDGGEPRPIAKSEPGFNNALPTFSRRGRELAYARCAPITCDLYVQELDSNYLPRGTPRLLTRHGLWINGIAWSQDDRWLAFSAGVTINETFLWRVKSSGQEPPQRLDIAGPRVTSPSIASVGDRLVYSHFVQDPDLWRYREGAPAVALVVSTASETNPQVSPDGSRIAFESNRSGAEEIWLADADGSRPVQLTSRLGRHQGTPRWSPDSRWIAFDSQGEDGRWDIYVVEASGGQPRRLTPDPSVKYIPSWSRDGKWIYFCSLRTGRPEIWRMPSAGGAEEQVTTDGGWVAFESMDGKTLYYNRTRPSGPGSLLNPLFAKPVGGGPERELAPDVTRSFEPTRDGVFFTSRSRPGIPSALQFFDFATGRTRTISAIEGRVLEGLAVFPDGKSVVIPVSRTAGADLMMIENLR